jgi:hypothetical protein
VSGSPVSPASSLLALKDSVGAKTRESGGRASGKVTLLMLAVALAHQPGIHASLQCLFLFIQLRILDTWQLQNIFNFKFTLLSCPFGLQNLGLEIM